MITSRARRSIVSLLLVACAGCAAPGTEPSVEPAKPAAPEPRPAAPAPSPPPPVRTAPTPSVAPSTAEEQLALGVQSYDDGEYKLAARQLQSALDAGLDSRRDQAKAHKYLAFMVCVSGREKPCRVQFHKALDADPGFELEPAEAGNPIWSAALRSVKAERAAKAKAKTKAKAK